jgi:glycosyltransferase involved in cell wall biosynthesis
VDAAIDIAIRPQTPLKIAAKVDRADRDYYEARIRHLLDHPLVEFLGEINEAEKVGFLGNALALLFPIDWPEPFGLAMIESMACGTPVIARRRGSVPEVVDDGVTGLVFESIDDGVEAVRRVRSMDRSACRARFESRFSSRRMAGDYLKIYERVLAQAPTETLAEIDARG